MATYISTQNAIHTHQTYAATLPQWTFYIFSNFKISDFNEETMSSLKKIWIEIETCWGVLSVF